MLDEERPTMPAGMGPCRSVAPGRISPVWWAGAAALALLVALHFALVIAWLTPPPWTPGAVRAAARVYVAPVFAQSWWLFAPDPPRLDRRAEVRGFYIAEGGERRATEWFPLTERLIRAVQEDRLSSRNAAWVVVLNSVYSLTVESQPPLRLRGGARELVLRAWGEPRRQPPGLIVLERAGSAALAATYPGRTIEEVQVRIRVRRLPAAESPQGEPGPEDELLFGPVPFARDIEAWSLAP